LQGGGSHGAFTWGVLDRLIEEPWPENRGDLRYFCRRDECRCAGGRYGRKAALQARRDALDVYWERVSRAAAFSPLQRSPLDRLLGRWTLDTSPAYIVMDLMTRMLSPYDLNPLGLNPLRAILAESIDFERLPRAPMKLFVTATSVANRSRPHLPQPRRSRPTCCSPHACLPTMFQAIEIDGEPYWDGGYAGNSHHHAAGAGERWTRHHSGADQIRARRAEPPRTANEILNRLNEISFNSPLMKELRLIALLRQVANPGCGEGARWAGMGRTVSRATNSRRSAPRRSSTPSGSHLAAKRGGAPQRQRIPQRPTAMISASLHG